MEKKEDNDEVRLERAFAAFKKGAKDIKGVDDSIKKEGGKSVIKYMVNSTDRETSRDRVETALKKEFKKVTRVQRSESSLECTKVEGENKDKKEKKDYIFIYKPISGGMSQTTLNATITELYPCIAFETGIKASSVGKMDIKKFHQQVSKNWSKNLNCFVNTKDAQAGKEFIDNAENGKFDEKVKNAINILRWIQGINRKHPIEKIVWGYRAKPAGVMANHPGDIFLQFKNKKYLGVSLKAGGAKTDEPKLNTYVKPIFDYFGKSNDYEKIKDKLWPQYLEIPGIEEEDKKDWGKNTLAMKTYEFEKMNSARYDALYDINLKIIKDELIKLIGSPQNFKKAKEWVSEKVAQQQQDVPLLVVKATTITARRDMSSDLLIEAVAAVKKIEAKVATTGGKQAFKVKLSDGSRVELDFTTRTNKVGASHKLGQFTNLAVKFNKVKKV